MKKPYTCPRCGYQTSSKPDMRKHLYNLKKTCPGQERDIELTNEIKDKIMANRIYHIEQVNQQQTQQIHQVYQQNNIQINHLVADMDVPEKLDKFTKHNNVNLVNFDDHVEDKFSKIATKLTNNEFRFGFELNKDDLLDSINQVCKLSQDSLFEDLNVYYDKKVDRINIYDGEWEELLLNKGIRKVLETIQQYYWDEYESYLLKKVITESIPIEKQKLRECLTEYYSFIGCFDVEPYVKSMLDNDIELYEQYYYLYTKTRDDIRKSEVNENRKAILDILKKNSDRNITELNKKICKLFNIDNEFQRIMNQFYISN